MLRSVPLTTFVHVLALGPGRRIVALREIHRSAVALRLDELVPVVERALADDLEVLTTRRLWRAARARAPADGMLANLGSRIDRLLHGLARDIRDIAVAAPRGDTRQTAARRLRHAVFHEARRATNRQTLLARARVVVSELGEARRSDSVVLGLEPRVTILRGLLEAYARRRSRLEEAPGETALPTWFDLRTAEEAGLARLRGIVARIVGAFPGDAPAERDARARLLSPVVAQQDTLIRAGSSGREPPEDVDPDTGEPEGRALVLPVPSLQEAGQTSLAS